MEFSKKARELLREQIVTWDLAARNYIGLGKVKVKTYDYVGYHIDIQFNPERIVSSSAKVDTHSIESRPCFLCQKNLPAQQRNLAFGDQFMILVNPFPIFPEHLTIPSLLHTEQRITGNFESMLDLAAALDDFVIFYNGPKCGASAPDHLHFQAGIKGFLPIEKDFSNTTCCRRVLHRGTVSVSHWPEYQRGIITLSGRNKFDLVACFDLIYNILQARQPDETEPMLNILAIYDNGEWIVHIFPRILHRPSQYFESGENQLVLSPASVDMGGVLITPREEDFNKIDSDLIRDIFSQVCLDPKTILEVINQLQ